MKDLDLGHFRFEPLKAEHDRSSFRCGEAELDTYLERQARQDVKRNLARVYVLTRDGKAVDGFYSLSAASIDPRGLPAEIARRLPRYGIPATLLGRMAVDQSMQGRNLGKLLLISALRTAWEGSRAIGSWAVVVDSKENARGFYIKHDFQPFPDHPSRLFLTMEHFSRLVSGMFVAN